MDFRNVVQQAAVVISLVFLALTSAFFSPAQWILDRITVESVTAAATLGDYLSDPSYDCSPNGPCPSAGVEAHPES